VATDRAALEAAIVAAPDERAPYLVYADFLQGEGDPRGELIVVQDAIDRLTDGERRTSQGLALYGREAVLLDKHAEHFLGALAPFSRDLRLPIRFEWRLGFLREAWFHRAPLADVPRGPHLVRALLELDSARFLERLIIEGATLGAAADTAETVATVAAGVPPTLRHLAFTHDRSPNFPRALDAQPLWTHPLEDVELCCMRLELGKPRRDLRALAVCTQTGTQELMVALTAAPWPRLERLCLFGALGDHELARQLVQPTLTPALSLVKAQTRSLVDTLLARRPPVRLEITDGHWEP
jgi:uncharacterized protein (TIGR02996 family)